MLTVTLFSLDHGMITGFEVGYNFEQVRIMKNDTNFIQEDYSESLYVTLVTGYRVEGLRIMGTYTNTMHPIRLDSFSPVQDRFRIDLNYTIWGFTVGLFHWCDHRVKTQVDERLVESNLGQRAFYIKYYKEF
jgi:hypothetical protein